MSRSTSQYLRWTLLGPLKLNQAKREQAIDQTREWGIRYANSMALAPKVYSHFTELTPEEFVDQLYSIWDQEGEKVSSRRRTLILPSEEKVIQWHTAESIGLTKLLGIRLD